MGQIHRSITESREPIVKPRFQVSSRMRALDDELRSLLLRIHEDGEIAQVVAAETHNVLGDYVVLYDPHPEDDKNRYLGWGVRGGKVGYVLLTDGGLSCSAERILFQEHEGRFYAEREELLEHFPKLTADRLEQCAENAVKRYLQANRKTVYR